jgi:putative peptide zinc metalloprotease protein
MNRSNGEPDGLWPDENQLVPLSSSSAAVAASPNGDRAPWLGEDHAAARPIRLSAGEFTTERMLRPSPNVHSHGWRRAVFTLSGGHIAMGPSPEEIRQRELVARVKTPVAGCRKIAFISRKGGVGKTSTCLLVGHTFAIHRGDRVVAVDGNPDAGTLGHRVRRETTANLTSLLADAGRIERYADVRGYTSQAPSRLEVVASDDDPRITQAIGEPEFHRAIELLERHYNLVCLDTGTGVLESATRGILAAADQVVVVSAPSLDGARAASATLDWLDANGFDGLVSESVAVLNAVGRTPGLVDVGRIEEHFARRCRACVRIPWDPHLEAGAEAGVDDLQPATRSAYLELAAAIGSGFANRTERRTSP